MKNSKKFLAEFMYQRMLTLAEFEQSEVFRKLYTDILRKLEKR